MSAQASVGRRLSFILITLLLGGLLGFFAGEVLVRVLGGTDADGNFWFRGRILGPPQPHLTRLTNLVEKLEAEEGRSLFTYDVELGWSFRPGAVSEDGRYHIDDRGIRTGTRAASGREGPVVALYGDSFTFCSDVLYEESWGYQLEKLLAEAGKRSQVLNLGGGGYGMGQAYLRWRSTHLELRPKIVVFGFNAENVHRNVNVIRAFYFPGTKLPFSKPRFVLEGDELGIVNIPCLPPREVLEVLRKPQGWKLLPWETFYIEGEREGSLWQHSRLVGLLSDVAGGKGPREERSAACFREDSEAFQLTIRMIQRFHDEVRADGSRFMILHMPVQGDLADARAGQPMRQAALLAELDRRGMTIVDPTRELLALAEREDLTELFLPHYSPSANRIIAEVLARNF
jgi:hypothetical protein